MADNADGHSKLFRREAIEEARSDTVRGGLLRLTPPWTVALFLSLLAVVLLGAGVAVFGTVRIHSSGRGVMRPEARVLTVRAPLAGVIKSVAVEEGARVRDGQLVVAFDDAALLADPDRANLAPSVLFRQQERLTVEASASGTVDRVVVRPGSYVVAGDLIATIVPGDGRLLGYLSLPARDWPYLRTGDPVVLKFDAYPWQEMGVGWGTLVRVGADADPADAVDASAAAAPQGFVRVAVQVDRMAPGATVIQNGMGFTGEVPLRTARISELILAPLAITPSVRLE
jgi:multidrug resistance efflux pump